MEIYKTKATLKKRISELKASGKTIGFVPTMGALHNGHLSLIECAKKQTDVSVVSIFVNPTQFNDPKDLEKYPRTVDADIEKLEQIGADLLFLPDVTEIYPKPDTRVFDFGNLDKVMEGKYRKGHFNGVAQVVSKLFDFVEPHKAFFGLKDFQQYVIIKELVRKYMSETGIEIIGCPIIRESDGLAMSSRNMLLSEEQRKNANLISQTLFKAKELSKNMSVEDVKKIVVDTINANPFLEVEYFEIVDDEHLETIKSWSEQSAKVGCIAVFCGDVRLIDNVYFD